MASTKPHETTEAGVSRRLVSSGSAFEARIGYSRAVVTGDWVFVSGCTGYDYATGKISPDPIQQAEQTMRNISAALAQAGSSVDEVVRVRYIVPRREDFKEMWPVLRRWFGDGDDDGDGGDGEDGQGDGSGSGSGRRKGPRPAATMLSCALLEEEMKVEIEVTARKGSALLSHEGGSVPDL
ncbi:Endoribonuclease L-PSP/chorismate mutase-like protein [Microdochium trichocladiopsis]|uniref:Endoribonuclease L-PSP/chorismate mutase-like protein n=1 Tax=Microdochium trichocladiopsis TaxID=1682393 RepID=A0A9P8YBF0_9PEZI|nr:Endoribonuclease L-PSP/chorismate mutase-like protein [Microdochium trichocladiopsis]KAH7034959.1 Endoribonuclease L-PSP/chorismate mutase-like protein [Microdochium trichocladiopsis]